MECQKFTSLPSRTPTDSYSMIDYPKFWLQSFPFLQEGSGGSSNSSKKPKETIVAVSYPVYKSNKMTKNNSKEQVQPKPVA